MIYLSQLAIDTGTGGDSFRPGLLWLGNMHRVRETLLRSFVREQQKVDLRPVPRHYGDRVVCDFPPTGQYPGWDIPETTYALLNPGKTLLFRADWSAEGNARLLVSTHFKPDWEEAFRGHKYLLAEEPRGPIAMQTNYLPGSVLQFRLLGHPVFETEEEEVHTWYAPPPPDYYDRKALPPVPEDDAALLAWLVWKGQQHGFCLEQAPAITPGFVYANKTHHPERGEVLLAALYDGLLRITDEGLFTRTIIGGIGPAREHGFGLLTVAYPGYRLLPFGS